MPDSPRARILLSLEEWQTVREAVEHLFSDVTEDPQEYVHGAGGHLRDLLMLIPEPRLPSKVFE